MPVPLIYYRRPNKRALAFDEVQSNEQPSSPFPLFPIRSQVEVLSSQKGELEGALALSHLAEAAHRRQAAEASSSSARTREELVKYVEEVHELLGVNAGLQREKLGLLDHLAAAEEAVKVGGKQTTRS